MSGLACPAGLSSLARLVPGLAGLWAELSFGRLACPAWLGWYLGWPGFGLNLALAGWLVRLACPAWLVRLACPGWLAWFSSAGAGLAGLWVELSFGLTRLVPRLAWLDSVGAQACLVQLGLVPGWPALG